MAMKHPAKKAAKSSSARKASPAEAKSTQAGARATTAHATTAGVTKSGSSAKQGGRHHGSCHCGRIAFEVEGTIDQVMDCNCSLCRRRGGLLWFVPRSALRLITPDNALWTYTFNKHVLQHHFCANCGVAPFQRRRKRRARRWPRSMCDASMTSDLSKLKVVEIRRPQYLGSQAVSPVVVLPGSL